MVGFFECCQDQENASSGSGPAQEQETVTPIEPTNYTMWRSMRRRSER